MKRLLFAATALTLVIGIVSCGKSTGSTKATASSEYETLAMATTGGAADKTPDPTTPVVAVVSIYTVKSDGSGLTKEMDSVDSLDASLLLKKLADYKIVAADTKVLNFTNKDGSAVLNLSALSNKDNRSIVAIANTFIENFELQKLTIQVNGAAISGGTDLAYEPGYKTLK